jgi:hypothetical protein
MANHEKIRQARKAMQREPAEVKDDFKIADSVCNIIQDIGAVEKDQVNSHQKYKFRGIDQAMAALQPLLVKHNVVLAPTYSEFTNLPLEKGSFVSVKLSLRLISTQDGSGMLVETYGTGTDFGDKALYKAMSGAFKYAVFQTFCIPTEEAKDPEVDSHEVTPGKPLTSEEEDQIEEMKAALDNAKTLEGLETLKSILSPLSSSVKKHLYEPFNKARDRINGKA